LPRWWDKGVQGRVPGGILCMPGLRRAGEVGREAGF
jgi:hypothetical protein